MWSRHYMCTIPLTTKVTSILAHSLMKEKDRKVLNAIIEYIDKHQYPPSFREIADMVGFKSSSTVYLCVSTLIHEGYLETDAEKAPRALRVKGYRFVSMKEYAESFFADCSNKKISSVVYDNVNCIISHISYTPEFHSTGRNSVHLQFTGDNGSFLEFEVFEEYLTYLIVQPNNLRESKYVVLQKIDPKRVETVIQNFIIKNLSNKLWRCIMHRLLFCSLIFILLL